jgi:hypothetical protein
MFRSSTISAAPRGFAYIINFETSYWLYFSCNPRSLLGYLSRISRGVHIVNCCTGLSSDFAENRANIGKTRRMNFSRGQCVVFKYIFYFILILFNRINVSRYKHKVSLFLSDSNAKLLSRHKPNKNYRHFIS